MRGKSRDIHRMESGWAGRDGMLNWQKGKKRKDTKDVQERGVAERGEEEEKKDCM